MARPCLSNVFQFAYGKHCFQCQFFSSRCKLWLPYTAGNFKENPSMQAPAKIFRARASEHSSNFCEQFEQRPNFASTFKLIGTIWYPLLCQSGSQKKSSWWQTRFQTATALKHRKSPNLNSIRIALYILKYWKTNLQSHPMLDKQRQQDPAMQWDIHSETERSWSVWTPQKAAIK